MCQTQGYTEIRRENCDFRLDEPQFDGGKDIGRNNLNTCPDRGVKRDVRLNRS